MNRVCALPAVFLLGSLAGIAQSSLQSPAAAPKEPMDGLAASAVLLKPFPANNCPTGIQVSESGIPRLIYINSAPTDEAEAGVFISVRDSRSVGIVAVWVTVRGYTHAHASSADAAKPMPGLAAKSFALPIKIAPGGEATRELWAKGFVGIASVELTGVRYADGSTWRAPAQKPCRFSAPNLYVAGVLR